MPNLFYKQLENIDFFLKIYELVDRQWTPLAAWEAELRNWFHVKDILTSFSTRPSLNNLWMRHGLETTCYLASVVERWISRGAANQLGTFVCRGAVDKRDSKWDAEIMQNVQKYLLVLELKQPDSGMWNLVGAHVDLEFCKEVMCRLSPLWTKLILSLSLMGSIIAIKGVKWKLWRILNSRVLASISIIHKRQNIIRFWHWLSFAVQNRNAANF